MGNNPSGNTFAYRIGTENHKSGTISFTVNTFSPYNGYDYPGAGANGPESLNIFKPPLVSYFYRQPTANDLTPLWKPLFRSAELNQVGHNNYDPGEKQIASPGYRVEEQNDSPYPITNYRSGIDFPYNTPPYENITTVDRTISDRGPDPVWVQTVRAFNFDELFTPEFTAESNYGIEYAILCENQVQIRPRTRVNNIVRSWVIADDLNYPQCAPWQGVNAVTVNGGTGNLFEYKRSSGNSDSLAYASASIDTWARSPYGDYLNELYTDATSYIAFIPNAGEEYINTRINRTIGGVPNALASWTDLPLNDVDGQGPAAVNENLQFVTGFEGGNFGNGKKILNTVDNSGVGAKRVKSGESAIQNSGTLRISKN